MSRAHSAPATASLTGSSSSDTSLLIHAGTLIGKIFFLARIFSLFILLGLAVVSGQLLGLALEGGQVPSVVLIVALVIAIAGIAHDLISLACLAARRLPSLTPICVADLLYSGGLLALVVLVGGEVTGTCDAGEAPFGFVEAERDDVCWKLSSAWGLGMAACGLFVASGVAAGAGYFVRRGSREGEGGRGRDVGLEEGRGGEELYPVDVWVRHQVCEATGGEGDDAGRMAGPSTESLEQRFSVRSALSQTFDPHTGVRVFYRSHPHADKVAARQQEEEEEEADSPHTGVRVFYRRHPHADRVAARQQQQQEEEEEEEGVVEEENEEEESGDSARSHRAVLRAREVARRTLEGEVDPPAPRLADPWGDRAKSKPRKKASVQSDNDDTIGARSKNVLPNVPEPSSSRNFNGPTSRSPILDLARPCVPRTLRRTTPTPLSNRAANQSLAEVNRESWETEYALSSTDGSALEESDAAPTRDVRTPDQQIPDPETREVATAPSRPGVRRARLSNRMLERPPLPRLFGVQSDRRSQSSGQEKEDWGPSHVGS
ncbi:hypothetical protein QBC39DRAFT_373275 [Podospora conica]|nr:hypothetical protein QBC39DRAFT_373275 [Schizothecium conicum]